MRLRDLYHNDHRIDVPGWQDTAENIDFSRLEGALEYDVCIVGAGFAGIACAYHLRKEGFSVALLEQNQVGWGASGRIVKENPCILRSSFDGHRVLSDYAKKAVAVTLEIADKLGVSIKNSDDDNIIENPVEYLLRQANIAFNDGVIIYEDARVKYICFEGKLIGRLEGQSEGQPEGHCYSLLTDTGKVTANHVILCTGAYLGLLDKDVRCLSRPRLVVQESSNTFIGAYVAENKNGCVQLGETRAGIHFIQGLGLYGIVDANLCALALKGMLNGRSSWYQALNSIKHKKYFFRRSPYGL